MITYADFSEQERSYLIRAGGALASLDTEQRVYALWSELGGLLATRQGEMSGRALTALRIAYSALWEGMRDG